MLWASSCAASTCSSRRGVGRDRRIFKQPPLVLENLFRRGNSLLDTVEFTRFEIGKLLLPLGCGRSLARGCRSIAPGLFLFLLPRLPLRVVGKTFRASLAHPGRAPWSRRGRA